MLHLVSHQVFPSKRLPGVWVKPTKNSLDIIMWPCDTWCFREDLHEFSWKSDDYHIIPFTSDEWNQIVDAYAT